MWILFPTFVNDIRRSLVPVGAGSDSTALKPGLYMSLARPVKVVQGFLSPLSV
jgi:hypothetical protein